MMLTTRVKKKVPFVGIRISSRGIAGFTDQRITFMHAQGATS